MHTFLLLLNRKIIIKMKIDDLKEQLDRIEESILSQKEVLTFEEAAQFTGLSKGYLYKLTSSKKVPHFKPMGKILYFNRKELEEWLQQKRVSTTDELEAKAQSYCRNTKIGGHK